MRWRWLAGFLLLSAATASAFLLLVQHRLVVHAPGFIVPGPAGTEALLDAGEAPAAAPGDSISLVIDPAGGGTHVVRARILSVSPAPGGSSIRVSIPDAAGIEPGTPVSATLAGKPVSLLRWLSRNVSAGPRR